MVPIAIDGHRIGGGSLAAAGRYTAAVLTALGLANTEIAALVASGAVTA